MERESFAIHVPGITIIAIAGNWNRVQTSWIGSVLTVFVQAGASSKQRRGPKPLLSCHAASDTGGQFYRCRRQTGSSQIEREPRSPGNCFPGLFITLPHLAWQEGWPLPIAETLIGLFYRSVIIETFPARFALLRDKDPLGVDHAQGKFLGAQDME